MANTETAEPKERTVDVTFLTHYNRGDGRTYGPGATVTGVPLSVANALKKRGVLRKASKEEMETAFPKEAKKSNPIDEDEDENAVAPGTVRGESGVDDESASPEAKQPRNAGEKPAE